MKTSIQGTQALKLFFLRSSTTTIVTYYSYPVYVWRYLANKRRILTPIVILLIQSFHHCGKQVLHFSMAGSNVWASIIYCML